MVKDLFSETGVFVNGKRVERIALWGLATSAAGNLSFRGRNAG